MSKLTIKKYQEYLKNVYKNRNNDQGLFIKLVEEIGEVAEQISIRDGRKDGDKEAVLEKLGKELADVIHYTIAIAGVNGIDLEKVILEKDLSAAIKYQHSTNLMEYIEQTAKNDQFTARKHLLYECVQSRIGFGKVSEMMGTESSDC